MIDIFDIIESRKDKHIKIKGEIFEYALGYDMDVINDFYNVLLDNIEHFESTKFDIEQITPTNRQSCESIIFDIDIHVDNYLWEKLADFESFIDYYTKGSIRYNITDMVGITTDSLEEYMTSGRIIPDAESVSISIGGANAMMFNWDYDAIDEMFNIHSRPVQDWQIGSHDADGDATYLTSLFSSRLD